MVDVHEPPEAAMTAFDQLPRTTRSLLMATLNLEVVSAGCANIVDLAYRRHQSVNEVWRDVCRKCGQIRCPMPPGILDTQYSAFSNDSEMPRPVAAAIPVGATIGESAADSQRPRGHAMAHADETDPTPDSKTVPANIRSTRRPTARRQARKWPVTLIAALSVLVVAGVGFFVVSGMSGQTSATAPQEAVVKRIAAPRESAPPAEPSVPPPQGTVHRMEEIRKAFSKK